MQNLDKLIDYLKSNENVEKISLEYLNGDKDKVDLADIKDIMTDIDWDQVDEVEVELPDGSKLEFGEVKEEEEEEEEESEEEEEEEEEEESEEEDSEEESEEESEKDNDDEEKTEEKTEEV
ncbi:hypothetical protein [Paenibacillus albiflavus]|uniref:hypothetical protein n=1 Tax=Paenibacillus albiflavus TaxID=2545760 RepID=UPI001405515A|nr:hypothetical protein [Paenibacillus albiflavus]